jgi:hypothetical protein
MSNTLRKVIEFPKYIREMSAKVACGHRYRHVAAQPAGAGMTTFPADFPHETLRLSRDMIRVAVMHGAEGVAIADALAATVGTILGAGGIVDPARQDAFLEIFCERVKAHALDGITAGGTKQ